MYPLHHPHYDNSISGSSNQINDINSTSNAEASRQEQYYSDNQFYPSAEVSQQQLEYQQEYYANTKDERYGSHGYYNENDQTRYYGYDYSQTSQPTKGYDYTTYDYPDHEKYNVHDTHYNQEYENYYSYSNEPRESERTDSRSHAAYYDASSSQIIPPTLAEISSPKAEQAYDAYYYDKSHETNAPVLEYAHSDNYYAPAQSLTQEEITSEGAARGNVNAKEYNEVWREEYPNYTPYTYEHDDQAYVQYEAERSRYNEPYNQAEYMATHTDVDHHYYYDENSENSTALYGATKTAVPNAYTSSYPMQMTEEMDRDINRVTLEHELLKRHRSDAYLQEHPYYPQSAQKLQKVQKLEEQMLEEEEEEYIPPFAPRVEIPHNLPLSLRSFLDVLAHYVVQGGPTLEEEIVAREIYNEDKKATLDNNSYIDTNANKLQKNTSSPFYFLNARFDDPRQRYYRWRLYSLLQGDEMDKWRTRPFQVERGNRAMVYIPPPVPPKGVLCLENAYHHLRSTRKPVVRSSNNRKPSLSSSSSLSLSEQKQEESANRIELPSCALCMSFGLTSQGHVFRTLSEEEMSEWTNLLTRPSHNEPTDRALSSTSHSSSSETTEEHEANEKLFISDDVARCMVFAIDHATCAHHLMSTFADNVIALAYKTAALITNTTSVDKNNKTTSNITTTTTTAANAVKEGKEMLEHDMLTFVNNMCTNLLWYLFVLNDIAHNSHAEQLTADDLDEMYMNKNNNDKAIESNGDLNNNKNDNMYKLSDNVASSRNSNIIEANKHKDAEMDVLELLAAKTKLAMSHRQQQQQRLKGYTNDKNKDNVLITNSAMHTNKKGSKTRMSKSAIPPAIQVIVGLHAAFELIVPIFIESYLLSIFAMLHKLDALHYITDVANNTQSNEQNNINSLVTSSWPSAITPVGTTAKAEVHKTKNNFSNKANDVTYEKSKNNNIEHDTNNIVNIQISVSNENSSYDTKDKTGTEKDMSLSRNDCVIKVISLLYWLRTLLIN